MKTRKRQNDFTTATVDFFIIKVCFNVYNVEIIHRYKDLEKLHEVKTKVEAFCHLTFSRIKIFTNCSRIDEGLRREVNEDEACLYYIRKCMQMTVRPAQLNSVIAKS